MLRTVGTFVVVSALLTACGGTLDEASDSLSELQAAPQPNGYPIILDADGHLWNITFNPNYGANGSVTTVCPDGTEVPVRVSYAGGGTYQYKFECPPLPGSQYWQRYVLYANPGTGNAWGSVKRSPWWTHLRVIIRYDLMEEDDGDR